MSIGGRLRLRSKIWCMSQPSPPSTESEAFKIYAGNLHRLVGLVKSSPKYPIDDLANLNATLISVVSTLRRLNNSIEDKTVIDPQGFADAAASELRTVLPLSANAIEKLTSRFFLHSWMTVMLVTFAEAYLEDALDVLMSTGLKAAALPIDVSDEMKRKWIRDILRNGRPHEWVKQLKRLGVTGYDESLPDRMKVIWERRHQIIHAAGSEFSSGSLQEFFEAVKVVNRFVDATDKLVQQLCLAPAV